MAHAMMQAVKIAETSLSGPNQYHQGAIRVLLID
jgi:hypothetical protein